MKHPLVELTKLVSASIPASEWAADPIASKQGVKNLVQAIKTKAARAGIHKINNILNVKIPIPVKSIQDAAKQVMTEKFDLDPELVKRMLEDFLVHIDSVKTKQIPDRVVKASTGMYHNAKEPEHAFNNSLGSFKTANESIVTLLDYARSLYLVANKYHAQIAN